MTKEEAGIKELKLAIAADFSDASIEDAILVIRNHTTREAFTLSLEVSVFDAKHAVYMMVDDWRIGNIVISRQLSHGEYTLTDSINKARVIGGLRND